MPFLIPERDDFDIQRADLSLGLRGAARYYNELVAPGIGGAWRVRHLSWAVAGIYLRQVAKTKASSAVLATALEALGNKLQWATAQDSTQVVGIRGRQAFGRHPDAWTFAQLSQKKFYVQISHRQQITRALPPDTGLYLAEGSSRFNGMTLTAVGVELAKAMLSQTGAGKGSPYLETNLVKWIEGTFEVQGHQATLVPLLGPSAACEEERSLVRGRLISQVSPNSVVGLRDPNRRSRLLNFLDTHAQAADPEWGDTDSLLRWLSKQPGGEAHVRDIHTAIAFEDMRNAAIAVIAALAVLVGRAGNRESLHTCVENPRVQAALEQFRTGSTRYRQAASEGNNGRPDALAFAAASDGTPAQEIEWVVRRDGRILQFTDNAVWAGPVFRVDVQSGRENDEAAEESTRHGRPNRLFQFIALWRDCHGQN